MVFRVDVNGVAGQVCVIEEMNLEWQGHDLKRIISCKSGQCICRIELFAGAAMEFQIRLDTPVRRIMEWMRPEDHAHVLAQWSVEDHQSSLFMKVKGIEDREIHDLLLDGICIKCMYACGVPLIDILVPTALQQVPIRWHRHCDAKTLFAAGISLKALLEVRNQDSVAYFLCGHPPCKEYTLFDSQLQAAGYTASDFRSAGFSATDLSYKASIFFRALMASLIAFSLASCLLSDISKENSTIFS